MIQKTKSIWFDGSFLPWDEANVHVLSHTIHYGVAVFEGIRSYKCSDGSSIIFRLEDHINRLFNSAKIVQIEPEFSLEEINKAVVETLQENQISEGYIRPIVFIGTGTIGVNPAENPVHTAIATIPWGAYLGEDALQKGVKVKTSSFTRHRVNIMMTKAKISGNYVNSVLAKREATTDGYDEALMLDGEGFVAEATGENIFIVKNGDLITTLTGSILPGITRDSIITLARDMGYNVWERPISRDEIYIADEAFFTGTAAELTPVRELDNRIIGNGQAGPITKLLQHEFFRILHGENLKYAGWLNHYQV